MCSLNLILNNNELVRLNYYTHRCLGAPRGAMIINTVIIATVFIFLINGLSPARDSEKLVNLCSNETVDYENYTLAETENCGCKETEACVRKCCRNGFYHHHDERPYERFFLSVCTRNKSAPFTVPIYDGVRKQYDLADNFLVGMLDCKNGEDQYQYFRMDKGDPRQAFYIQKNGSLFYPFYGLVYDNSRYCVDERDGLTAYLCLTPKVVEGQLLIHVTAKIISLPFLLATFLIYAVLPESNLHTRAMMFHVLCLLLGYVCLVLGQYNLVQDDTLCKVLGFSIIFFMTTSYFWMNVMCVDLWLTFSGLRGFYRREARTKNPFLIYYTYAWGVPSLMVLLVYLLDAYVSEESTFYPGVGVRVCFLSGNLQTLLYYFGPILILVVINTILFILTTINIRKVRREISALQKTGMQRHTAGDDRKNVRLYWKLLFVMGINPVVNTHIVQTIAWIVSEKTDDDIAKYILYFKDFSHAMYGICIFVVFACKKKIWISLEKRYWCVVGHLIPSDSSTHFTDADNGPSGQTSIELEGRKEEDTSGPLKEIDKLLL